jgi:hypothetical protein
MFVRVRNHALNTVNRRQKNIARENHESKRAKKNKNPAKAIGVPDARTTTRDPPPRRHEGRSMAPVTEHGTNRNRRERGETRCG